MYTVTNLTDGTCLISYVYPENSVFNQYNDITSFSAAGIVSTRFVRGLGELERDYINVLGNFCPLVHGVNRTLDELTISERP